MDNGPQGKGWTEYGHVSYLRRMETTDGRWKGEAPQPAPDKMKLVNRVRAAKLADVSPRTISRWAKDGILRKYKGPRGSVLFSEKAVRALYKAPEDMQETSHRAQAPEPSQEPVKRRW